MFGEITWILLDVGGRVKQNQRRTVGRSFPSHHSGPFRTWWYMLDSKLIQPVLGILVMDGKKRTGKERKRRKVEWDSRGGREGFEKDIENV